MGLPHDPVTLRVQERVIDQDTLSAQDRIGSGVLALTVEDKPNENRSNPD